MCVGAICLKYAEGLFRVAGLGCGVVRLSETLEVELRAWIL